MSAAPEQPSPSAKAKDPAWGGSAGSNLYLATFLATLCLLLFGSCCIVIRSYLIRRRFRRRIQEVLVAEGLSGASPRCRCRKRRPKFHERWIAPALGSSWGDITPLSLRVVFGKRAHKPGEPKTEIKTETKKLGLKSWKPSKYTKSIRHNPQEPTTTSTKFEMAQVSVLIEMPSPERSTLYGRPKLHLKPTYDDEDDDEVLPELVIGYARCHKHWWMDVVTDVANTKGQNNSHRPQ